MDIDQLIKEIDECFDEFNQTTESKTGNRLPIAYVDLLQWQALKAEIEKLKGGRTNPACLMCHGSGIFKRGIQMYSCSACDGTGLNNHSRG